MTLELEIDVPESRTVTLTLPPDTPVGKAKVSVQAPLPVPEPVAAFDVTLDSPATEGDDGSEAYRRERAAFRAMLPELLKTHRGKYVAIHGGRVIAEGDNDAAVTTEAYAQVGYTDLYVDEVTETPRVYRILSPRVLRGRRA